MQWEAYRNLSGLAKIDPAKQVQVLTLCLSRETIAVVHNLGLSDEQMKDVAQIITAMRRRVPASIPIRTSVERQPMPPRRSLRARKPVNRLIEDPAWA